MEAKSVTVFEVKKDTGIYQFVLPANAKYGEAYDAAIEFGKQIWEMAEKARLDEEEKIASAKNKQDKSPQS